MSIHQADVDRLRQAVAQSIHDHWVFFLVEGLVLVVLGMAAVLIPLAASLAVAIVIGWLFLISGGVGLFTTMWLRHAPGFWWSLVSAVLGIAAGIILLSSPVRALLPLTLVLVVFFMIEGIVSIMFALDHRRELTGRWGWMLVSGIVDLVLAGIIWSGFPGTAEWAIGLLVGINMLMGGTSLIAIALHARASVPQVSGSAPGVRT
jgi:uncharacterized membrane protein HdeD (DUF308 family)